MGPAAEHTTLMFCTVAVAVNFPLKSLQVLPPRSLNGVLVTGTKVATEQVPGPAGSLAFWAAKKPMS